MTDVENIKTCIDEVAKGRKDRRDVQKILENKDEFAKVIKWKFETGTFVFHTGNIAIINESSTKKQRIIAKPSIVDQIGHHMLISQLRPIVMRHMYEYSVASIPGKGVHHAKRAIEKWIRRYGRKRVYVLKADVYHFYDQLNHGIVKGALRRYVRDEQYLKYMDDVIDAYPCGLAKGYYTSVWLSNLVFMPIDRMIMQDWGADHYVRYMDDIVIFSRNKRKLRMLKENLSAELSKLGLRLKGDWQIFKFDDGNGSGRDIDFMGFRFFRNKTTLRKSLLRTIRRKAYRLNKKKCITAEDAASMICYCGWTQQADVYGYYQKWIKPIVNRRLLRNKVSERSKHDGLERGKRKRVCKTKRN